MVVEELKIGDEVDFRRNARWYFGVVTHITPKKVTFTLSKGSFSHGINAKMAVPRVELTELRQPS